MSEPRLGILPIVRINGPDGEVGVITIKDRRVHETSPELADVKGWDLEQIDRYCESNGYDAELVNPGSLMWQDQY
jgi:hypothetical protein